MANSLEYILSLKDQMSASMKKIGVSSDVALEKFAELEKQSEIVQKAFSGLGTNVTTLNQKIALLKAERDLIPAKNVGAIRKYNDEIRRLSGQVEHLQSLSGDTKLHKWFRELKSAIPGAALLSNPLLYVAAGIWKVTSYVKSSTEAYKEEAEQLVKLRQVMSNTMDAREENVQSVQRLMKAQEQLGVISATVQSAGAQEIATYLSREESIHRLLPVMNDMLAQQYGINATQEQAINIASMMGKVMDGQVGALSRYGYKFTEAQERVLKYGNETQRAATLADVVNDSVQGVNEALAASPEGKIHKTTLAYENMRARIGSVMTKITGSFTVFHDKVLQIFDKVVSKVEKHEAQIVGLANIISKVLGGAIDTVSGTIGWFIAKLREGNPIIVGLAAVVGVLTTSLIVYNTWIGIVTLATKLWSGAQAILNAIMYANPVGLIIAGVIALIAAIAYLVYKIDGWGQAWDHVVNYAKFTWELFTEGIKHNFNTMVNGLMVGIDKIKLGWYKFREAVGIGDSTENQKMIAQINKSVESRKKEIEEGNKKVKGLEAAAMAEQFKAVNSLSWNDKSLSDLKDGLMNKLGISAPGGIPGAAGTGIDGKGAGGGGNLETATGIATGGTKHNYITINLKDLIGVLNLYTKDSKDSAKQLQDNTTDALMRVLAMATTAGS